MDRIQPVCNEYEKESYCLGAITREYIITPTIANNIKFRVQFPLKISKGAAILLTVFTTPLCTCNLMGNYLAPSNLDREKEHKTTAIWKSVPSKS